MENKVTPAARKPGILAMFFLGIVLFFIGTPFLGMTMMTILLLKELRKGLFLALAVLVGIYLFSDYDFNSALIAALGAGILVTGIKLKWEKHVIIAAASALLSLVAVYRVLLFPESFPLLGEHILLFLEFYRTAGLSEREIISGFSLILRIFPGLLAIWATIGTLTASIGIQSYYAMKEKRIFKPSESFHLGLVPAWILILSLFVFAVQSSLPSFLPAAALNIALYILLLYSIVGIIVVHRFLRTSTQFVLPVVILAVFMLPFLVTATTLLGILDTWFDFRTKIRLRIERKLTQ